MRKTLDRIVIVGVLASCGAGASADDLALAEKQIIKNWQKHRSIKAKVARREGIEARGNKAARSGEGSFELLRKGDEVLFRHEVKSTWEVEAGERKTILEDNVLTVCDGKYQYELSDRVGLKTARKCKPDPLFGADVKALVELLQDSYDLNLLEEESVDGHEAFVITATRKGGRQGALRKSRVYFFSKEHGVLLKLEERDRHGKANSTLTYTDFEFDLPIDPKRFEFETPKGVFLEDKTSP